MALQGSGAISFAQIAAEYGDSQPHSLSEFYRNGAKVPGHESINSNVPTSGTIRFAQFYSTFDEELVELNNSTNINAQTAFGSSIWTGSKRKRIIVPAGVTIGGVGADALTVPGGMGGQLIITCRGSIQGYGGSANGGTGGNAINIQQNGNFFIENYGTIYAGGGGGGQGGQGGLGGSGGSGGQGGSGGTGGGGEYTQSTYRGHSNNYCVGTGWQSHNSPIHDESCRNTFGSTAYCGSGGRTYGGSRGCPNNHICSDCYTTSTVNTNGGSGGSGGNGGGGGSGGSRGSGGAGGRGQGYSQSRQNGSGGSSGGNGNGGSSGAGGNSGASGGQNSGNGGTGGQGGTGGSGGQGGTGGSGGNGGDWGQAGGSGNTGSNGATGNGGASGNTGGSGANGNRTSGGTGSGGGGGSNGSGGGSGLGGSGGGQAGFYVVNYSYINTFTNYGSGAAAGRT